MAARHGSEPGWSVPRDQTRHPCHGPQRADRVHRDRLFGIRIKASPGASAYCASKAALRLFAKTAALECIEHGDNIRVNTVLPAGVVTPMWKSMELWPALVKEHGGEEGAWKALGAFAEKSPLKRFATPAEVARGILCLASDESSFVTGTELVVDGGYTA